MTVKKRTVTILLFALCYMTTKAIVPERRMLEQGKSWTYYYHHFEANETGYDTSMWLSYYQLNGDTVIDGRQYMKMYRWDDQNNKKKYFAAFREDEEGRVYMLDSYSKKEVMALDFSLHYEDGYFPNVVRIAETIKENSQLFRRFRYQDVRPDGSTYDLGYVAVEGVGFQGHGLIFDPYAPEPDCICDYESLAYVSCRDFWFDASAFNLPKEIELTEDELQLIASNNDFAFNLFRKARGEDNCVLSPLSITYALGMLNNGAAGKTQQEINDVLGFGKAGADGINQFCRKMLTEASTLDKKTKALIANTIYVNEGLGYRLQDDFVRKANDYYDAQPQNRDFGDGQTMSVINQWASDHTEGLIPSVLNEDIFKPFAVSYLLNALYFKGAWSHPFNVEETKEDSFNGGTAVPMMHLSDTELEYSENDIFQSVILPYGNGAYRMSIYLPREGKTINDVLKVLDGKKWQPTSYHPNVDLKLPRFETDTQMPLVEIMSALGMPSAFTKAAEFPYFCNSPVFIGDMFQVAKIKLDEEGTEAAAVTVIVPEKTSIPQNVKFHAIRPFLYIISEQSTGAIFFIGQYMGADSKSKTNAIDIVESHNNAKANGWYKLNGQQVTKPHHGLYIVRMSDGTARKVVEK